MEGVKRNIELDLSRESYSQNYKEVFKSIPEVVMDELQEAVIMREMALLGHKLTGIRMSVESIVRAVENEYGVSFAMIKEHTRKRYIVEPRQIIEYMNINPEFKKWYEERNKSKRKTTYGKLKR